MLNKITKCILLVSISAAFLSCTVERPAAPERSITVSANASVSIKADLVSLKFMVRTQDWNVNKASDKNAEITNKVLEAIKNAGVDPQDITTADYSIYQDLSKSYPGQYTVQNSIKVLIRNTELTGKVIDSAVVSGANGLTSFTYLAEDKSTALRQARTQAIQNAQDAANLLAGASGAKVGNVMEITETYASNANTAPSSALMLKSNSTPIQEGYVEVESHVTVKYSLE